MSILKSLRVCVLGAASVGKSALAVRMLTGRFIGSYSSSSCSGTSSKLVRISPRQQLQLFVREVSSSASASEIATHLEWGECFIVMLSREEPQSLLHARWLLEQHQRLKELKPVILVANKADLSSEEKRLSLDECQELALDQACLFLELSTQESSIGCRLLLLTLVSEVTKLTSGTPYLGKKISLASRKIWMKVFGALFKMLCSLGEKEKKDCVVAHTPPVSL